MRQPQNPMEIFKLLDKSNCRRCNEATCLAFAVAVFQGRKKIDECPAISEDAIKYCKKDSESRTTVEQDMYRTVELLKGKISTIDLSEAARRIGGRYNTGKLTMKILGKDFSIESNGNLSSDIHVNPWIAIPVLNYVHYSAGEPLSEKWVPLRELKKGKDWYRLFGQRCEKPLKKVADTYTDLFEDMLNIFNGKKVENHYESDISLVLHPLPMVPLLICYWMPEDGLESNLNLFFDSTADDNLPIESIYALGTGLVRMFEKISLRHGLQ